ncbi:MAG: Crp/Fnr family transcriptional regulator [Bacteroidota bacterium]
MDRKPEKLFQNYFGKHIHVSSRALQFLSNHFYEKRYQAREIIVEAGTVEKYFYLVLEGVQALYTITERGEKSIAGFSYRGEQSGVFDSFVTQKSSALFLEALTSSTLLAISRTDFKQLFEQFPEFYKWEARFLEQILIGRFSREKEMLTYNAKERFDAFMERCPKELLDIPQKHLASYLNMKPETFSRLRALRD